MFVRFGRWCRWEGRLSEDSSACRMERDLVIATIPGVQRFVAESRRTADLFVSSDIISELAGAMVGAVTEPAELVLPGTPDMVTGIPNRVVALAGRNQGRALAQAMADAVQDRWARIRARSKVEEETPGFPAVQWVVVPPSEGGYEAQWERAQRLLLERKRVRDFVFPPAVQERVCTLTGRWSAPRDKQEEGVVRRGEHLSAVGRIKRGVRSGFPSTWSIALAPYRADVVELADTDQAVRSALDNIRESISRLADDALPRLRKGLKSDLATWFRGLEGSWCVPETWDPRVIRREHDLRQQPDRDVCESGRQSAHDLKVAARAAGARQFTPYLAVLAQDADRLGESLSDGTRANGPMREWHGRISAALGRVGPLQRKAIESAQGLGRVVYSGGDDLLALVPAATATTIARQSYDAFRQEMAEELPRATISTALVFFHASWPLQSAVAAAQELLEQAKNRSRPGLAIAVQHRGGERARWVTPWLAADSGQILDHLEHLVQAMTAAQGLSKRLAISLEADADELATLTPAWLHMELRRRAVRHGMPETVGTALRGLCAPDGDRVAVPVDALLVARFLATGDLP
ncbi:type III-B CRISPR-associated protein Cas10/Cmr2 [Microbispora bryophytorum]|uniref:type III-B CRISPR-associated protein Cas10/Cmr2 n=1 Tax=Microbispora bryophytorum TaxID=1460882 RepID=UPI0033EA79DC